MSRRQSLLEILSHNHTALPDADIERLIAEKNAWYRQSLHDLVPQDILPGIADLLKDLRAAGIKTAIASASRNAPFILERLGLTQAFDVVVPAELVVKGKPDPEVFVRAAEALGLDPQECTGIEDAPAGITAIRQARMRVVGVGSAVDPELCDLHVDRTEQLSLEGLLF